MPSFSPCGSVRDLGKERQRKTLRRLKKTRHKLLVLEWQKVTGSRTLSCTPSRYFTQSLSPFHVSPVTFCHCGTGSLCRVFLSLCNVYFSLSFPKSLPKPQGETEGIKVLLNLYLPILKSLGTALSLQLVAILYPTCKGSLSGKRRLLPVLFKMEYPVCRFMEEAMQKPHAKLHSTGSDLMEQKFDKNFFKRSLGEGVDWGL